MLNKPSCSFTFAKFLQYLNAQLSIVVTLLGISILIKLLQSQNAFSPIISKVFENSMLLKPSQPKNAPLLILVIVLGFFISFKLLQFTNVFF